MFSKCSTAIRRVFTGFVKSYTSTRYTKQASSIRLHIKDHGVVKTLPYTRGFMWWVLWHILEDLEKREIKRPDFSNIDIAKIENRPEVSVQVPEQSFANEESSFLS